MKRRRIYALFERDGTEVNPKEPHRAAYGTGAAKRHRSRLTALTLVLSILMSFLMFPQATANASYSFVGSSSSTSLEVTGAIGGSGTSSDPYYLDPGDTIRVYYEDTTNYCLPYKYWSSLGTVDAAWAFLGTATSGSMTSLADSPYVDSYTTGGAGPYFYLNLTVSTDVKAGSFCILYYHYSKSDSSTIYTEAAYYYVRDTPTISVGAASFSKEIGDSAFSLGASTTSDATLTYSSSNTGVVTVSGGTATVRGVGTATVTITSKATTKYVAATKTVTVTVSKGMPTVSRRSGTNRTYTKTIGDDDFSIQGATTSGAALTYTSSDDSVVSVETVSGRTNPDGDGTVFNPYQLVTGETGTADVTANAIAASNSGVFTIDAYYSSDTSVLTVDSSGNVTAVGAGTAYVYAHASYGSIGTNFTASDYLTYFEVFDTENEGKITINGAGTATITITSAETDYYEEESVAAVTITVKNETTVSTDTDAYSKTYGDDSFILNASTNSDGELSYSSSNESVVTVDYADGKTEDGYGSSDSPYQLLIGETGEATKSISIANNVTTAMAANGITADSKKILFDR